MTLYNLHLRMTNGLLCPQIFVDADKFFPFKKQSSCYGAKDFLDKSGYK